MTSILQRSTQGKTAMSLLLKRLPKIGSQLNAINFWSNGMTPKPITRLISAFINYLRNRSDVLPITLPSSLEMNDLRIGNLISEPINWLTTCKHWVWDQRCWLACVWNARLRWWWGCWASSRQAELIFRLIL